jgi:aspartyl-tRNA(Asn)/glutamyl-tRNA(Gln) amidotransferase subunit C
MISKETVLKVANLARLSVDDSKAQRYSVALSAIFGHMEKLQSVDVSSVEPMTHVHGSKNIFREDVVEPSFSAADALQNAPDRNGQFFRVPLIKDHND